MLLLVILTCITTSVDRISTTVPDAISYYCLVISFYNIFKTNLLILVKVSSLQHINKIRVNYLTFSSLNHSSQKVWAICVYVSKPKKLLLVLCYNYKIQSYKLCIILYLQKNIKYYYIAVLFHQNDK